MVNNLNNYNSTTMCLANLKFLSIETRTTEADQNLKPDLGQTQKILTVTDKLYHIILYEVQLTVCRNQTYNFSGDRHCMHR